MREAALEKYFVAQTAKLGGWAVKWASPSLRGVPDRLVWWPQGYVESIELKTETGRLSASQKAVIARLTALGHTVHTLYGRADVDEWLEVRRQEFGDTK